MSADEDSQFAAFSTSVMPALIQAVWAAQRPTKRAAVFSSIQSTVQAAIVQSIYATNCETVCAA